MSTILSTCPHCSYVMKFATAQEGVQGKCASCFAVFTIATPGTVEQLEMAMQQYESAETVRNEELRKAEREKEFAIDAARREKFKIIQELKDDIRAELEGRKLEIRTCPVCNQEMDADATRCPHCVKAFLGELPDRPPPPSNDPMNLHATPAPRPKRSLPANKPLVRTICVDCEQEIDSGATRCPRCAVRLHRTTNKPAKNPNKDGGIYIDCHHCKKTTFCFDSCEDCGAGMAELKIPFFGGSHRVKCTCCGGVWYNLSCTDCGGRVSAIRAKIVLSSIRCKKCNSAFYLSTGRDKYQGYCFKCALDLGDKNAIADSKEAKDMDRFLILLGAIFVFLIGWYLLALAWKLVSGIWNWLFPTDYDELGVQLIEMLNNIG